MVVVGRRHRYPEASSVGVREALLHQSPSAPRRTT